MDDKPAREKWKSRKLWSALLFEAIHVGLLVHGHIMPEHFVTLTLFTFGGWFGSEASEKWAQR